jgi:hypothetical protein
MFQQRVCTNIAAIDATNSPTSFAANAPPALRRRRECSGWDDAVVYWCFPVSFSDQRGTTPITSAAAADAPATTTAAPTFRHVVLPATAGNAAVL